MCGISAIIDPTGSPGLVQKLLAMHGVIRHRGPDGEGFLVVDAAGVATPAARGDRIEVGAVARVGFAFRRLKICDLSEAAAQPMASDDRQTWIVFNGEIYNFRDLRKELQAKGHVFRTTGDTEVALAAYREWGTQCFDRLDGMWAIVILDLRRRRLLVSRDRFGIKPLFWTIDDSGALLLASEIKQLIAASKESYHANRPLIAMYLRGQRYPVVEETFFARIRAVPPATWCDLDLDAPSQLRFQPYWKLADITADENQLPYAQAVDRVEDALTRAVASQRRADVKVGALLSGGLDSSTLVALAHRTGGPRLPTFSLGYRDAAPDFCEMRYVDAMARQDRLENYETTFDAAWIADNTDRILWTLEEPPLAMPAFAQFRLFELCAQEGATVVLDGQGSDEITGGYQYHQRGFLKERILQRRPMAMLTELIAMARRDRRSSAAIFAGFFIRPYLQRRPSYPWIANGGSRPDEAEFAHARSDYGHDHQLVNRLLYFDVRWGNVKIVLGYGDRNAMAHSVEARVPYFDRAFVELLFSLPDAYKVGNGDRKRILRDIARRYVPPEITERPDRMGFGTPDGAMIRGPLREAIEDAVNEPAFRAAGWADAAQAAQFLRDFYLGRHSDYRAVWRLFALSRWARRFCVTA